MDNKAVLSVTNTSRPKLLGISSKSSTSKVADEIDQNRSIFVFDHSHSKRILQ